MKARCLVRRLRRVTCASCLWTQCIGLPAPVLGQANYSSPYTITTLAGGFATGGADGVGSSARFYFPTSVTIDSAGNLIVVDGHNSTIRQITPAGVVSTLAGTAGIAGSTNGTGSVARFNDPEGAAADSAGNIYVADSGNNLLREISPAGAVTTIAGQAGITGSADGTNTAALFNSPTSVAVDAAGNVYVSDYNNDTIRQATSSGTNWVVTTIAGSPGKGGTNDGIGSVARFNGPAGLAMDNAGNLYVADVSNCTIRKLTPVGTNWSVTTLAGKAGAAATVNGTNSLAEFNGPQSLAVDSAGNIFVAEPPSDTIREVSPQGTNWVVTTLAGFAGNSGSADGTNNAARFNYPFGIGVDAIDDLYIADFANNTIRKATPAGTNWVVTTFAGMPGKSLGNNDGAADGTNGTAQFYLPQAVAVDTNDSVYVADLGNSTIRKVTPDGVVTTLAGLAGVPGNADGTNSTARFNYPNGVAVDGFGNVYVADLGNGSVRLVTSAGVVKTLASGLSDPSGVAVDGAGNIYVANSGVHTICELTPAGTNWDLTTLAGMPGSPGTNDGAGSDARFLSPQSVAVDTAGNIYVADTGNSTIRKMILDGTNWTVTTIAGQPGVFGYADGTNAAALFGWPLDSVAVDSAGNIYVADLGNNVVRKVAPVGTNWVVTTIAGGGLPSVATVSMDGTGSNAIFSFFSVLLGGIAADSAGNIYVADAGNNLIRKGYPTSSLRMPVLQTPCLSAGQFASGIFGVPNLYVDVQSSSDLSNWQFAGSYVLTGGSNYFVSPYAPQGSQFYRVHVR